MNTQSTPVVIDTDFGKLHIAVACADPHSYHDMERGNVTDLRPELWVATDAGFDADPNAADHWTIRKQPHALHYHVVRERGEWTRNYKPYGGGFISGRGGPVKFGTKTWDLMWEAMAKALDAFHEENPGWEDLSLFMLHQANESSARGKAEDARREAKKYDETAEGHRVAKDKVGATVPASLLALLPSAGN